MCFRLQEYEVFSLCAKLFFGSKNKPQKHYFVSMCTFFENVFRKKTWFLRLAILYANILQSTLRKNCFRTSKTQQRKDAAMLGCRGESPPSIWRHIEKYGHTSKNMAIFFDIWPYSSMYGHIPQGRDRSQSSPCLQIGLSQGSLRRLT
jgi:hypothetical protein